MHLSVHDLLSHDLGHMLSVHDLLSHDLGHMNENCCYIHVLHEYIYRLAWAVPIETHNSLQMASSKLSQLVITRPIAHDPSFLLVEGPVVS